MSLKFYAVQDVESGKYLSCKDTSFISPYDLYYDSYYYEFKLKKELKKAVLFCSRNVVKKSIVSFTNMIYATKEEREKLQEKRDNLNTIFVKPRIYKTFDFKKHASIVEINNQLRSCCSLSENFLVVRKKDKKFFHEYYFRKNIAEVLNKRTLQDYLDYIRQSSDFELLFFEPYEVLKREILIEKHKT
jgi:hypothetical protein